MADEKTDSITIDVDDLSYEDYLWTQRKSDTELVGVRIDANNVSHNIHDAIPTATTDTAGRWTIDIPTIKELHNGLTIRVFLSTSYNGTFNTLNVNGLGEQLVWFRSNTRLTSHYAQYSILTLTYMGSGTNCSYAISNGYAADYTDKGTWVASTNYVIGDRVKNGSTYYICKKAHKSDTSFSATNWNTATTPTTTLVSAKNASTTITGGWIIENIYDSNDVNYRDREYYFRPYSGADPIYRYKICSLDSNNRLIPLVLTNQADTTMVAKVPTQREFNPDKLFIYATTTTLNANTACTASALYSMYADCSYSAYTFNTSLATYQNIYLKGTYNPATNLFKLHSANYAAGSSDWYIQVPCNSTDISSYFEKGFYYIYIGGTYSTANYLNFFQTKPLYYFNGTSLVSVGEAIKEDLIDDSVSLIAGENVHLTATASGVVISSDGTPEGRLSGTVTKTVGGINAGTILSDKSLSDILSDILFPYVQFSFSKIETTAAAGTFEYGTSKTITQVKPTFTLGSKSITSVAIGTTSGGHDLYSGTTATSGSNITLSTSTSWDGKTTKTIYCTIGDGVNTDTKSVSFTPAYYTYYKVTNSTTPPTSGATKTNSQSSTTAASGDSNITTTANTYIWFLSKVEPKNKKIQQYVTGQWNDMNTTAGGTVTLTLASGQQVTYYTYRTDKMVAATGRYQLI